MNYSIKQQHTTIGYNSIPDPIADDDKTAAVPFGTTILPSPTTTMDRRSLLKWNRVAIVALMIMLLVVVVAGGDTVLLRREGDIAAAEGLVVALQPSAPCLPAGGTFGGVSTVTDNGGDGGAFETCFQFGTDFTYCWTKSYSWYENSDSGNSLCAPNGDAWQTHFGRLCRHRRRRLEHQSQAVRNPVSRPAPGGLKRCTVRSLVLLWCRHS